MDLLSEFIEWTMQWMANGAPCGVSAVCLNVGDNPSNSCSDVIYHISNVALGKIPAQPEADKLIHLSIIFHISNAKFFTSNIFNVW